MEYFLSNGFKIAVLLNPFAVLSTFIALAGKRSVEEKARIMFQTCFASAAAGLIVLFSGNLIFSLMDINLDLFKVGGGTVLMICSISLVWGREGKVSSSGSGDSSISVVPLAIPMAVGPGTAAGLIIIGSEHNETFLEICSNIGALFCGILVLGCVLALGVWSGRLLNKTTISIVTRLTGLFLSGIAAKMILEGIGNVLQLK